MAAADTATAEDPDLPVRAGIGIRAGESAETAEGYVGSSVNNAARVCAQAGTGEVLITDTVRILIRTSLALGISARRKKQLEGISEPVALFAVTAVEAGSGGGGRRRTSGALVAPGGAGGRRAILGGAVVLLVAVLGAGALFAAGAFKQVRLVHRLRRRGRTARSLAGLRPPRRSPSIASPIPWNTTRKGPRHAPGPPSPKRGCSPSRPTDRGAHGRRLISGLGPAHRPGVMTDAPSPSPRRHPPWSTR